MQLLWELQWGYGGAMVGLRWGILQATFPEFQFPELGRRWGDGWATVGRRWSDGGATVGRQEREYACIHY